MPDVICTIGGNEITETGDAHERENQDALFVRDARQDKNRAFPQKALQLIYSNNCAAALAHSSPRGILLRGWRAALGRRPVNH